MMTPENNDFSRKDGVSLKQYVDELNEAACRKCDTFRGMCSKSIEDRLDGLQKTLGQAIENVKESTTLARTAMEFRLGQMNEIREAMREQAANFITRAEFEKSLELLGRDIKAATKGRVSWGVALAITVLTSATLSLVVLLVTLGLK